MGHASHLTVHTSGGVRRRADQIDYRLKPLVARFGDMALADIKTADIDDFITDLKQPRVVHRVAGQRRKPASVNRAVELLRHMLNWAVGREYLARTPSTRHRGSCSAVAPLSAAPSTTPCCCCRPRPIADSSA